MLVFGHSNPNPNNYRNMNCITNTFAQYEICFGNKFFKKLDGSSIKSTGFKVAGESETVYFLDVPVEDSDIGILSIVKPTLNPDTFEVVKKSIGIVGVFQKMQTLVGTLWKETIVLIKKPFAIQLD